MYLMQFMCDTDLNFVIHVYVLLSVSVWNVLINNKRRHIENVKLSFSQISVDLMGQICEFYAFDKGHFVTFLTDWANFNWWTEIWNYQQLKYKTQRPML